MTYSLQQGLYGQGKSGGIAAVSCQWLNVDVIGQGKGCFSEKSK